MVRFTIEERPSDSPFVAAVWRTRSERTGVFISEAASHWEMVLTRHDGATMFTVRGPETKATTIDCTWTEGEFVGIVFRLGVFMPHLPPGAVMDRRDAHLPVATRSSFWLRGSAWQYPDYENADTFVDRLVRAGLLVCDPVVATMAQGHTRELAKRSLQYHFLRATGLTYRAFQQIERARKAMDLLEQGMPIPDVVYRAGYFDQPHLTRSLKRFMGRTPAHIARTRHSN